MTCNLIIIDGVPASGKTTLVKFLEHSYNIKIYNYTRLGFVNMLAKILMKITPSVGELPNIKACRFTYGDPIMIVNTTFLKRISLVIFFLEVIYKFIQYSLIFLLSLVNKTVVVDEGPSLGWANYLNLLYSKNALRPNHVVLLMRLDLRSLWFLSKFHKVQIYFIDRNQDKLNKFWYLKGYKTPYETKFANLVRYSFKLFAETSAKYITIRYIYVES
jgi:hypothetical protein